MYIKYLNNCVQVRKIYISIQTESCIDSDNGVKDRRGYGCDYYVGEEISCGVYDTEDFDAESMCCACRGKNSIQTYLISNDSLYCVIFVNKTITLDDYCY